MRLESWFHSPDPRIMGRQMDGAGIPVHDDQGYPTYRRGIRTFRTEIHAPITRYAFWVLAPLLGLYLMIAVIASSSAFVRDEGGYVENASRMVHGPYVSPPDIRLWWGPGYSFVLVPFIVLKLPWLVAKCLNAGFLFGAIIYFYRLIQRYISRTAALVITFTFGLYPPFMRELPYLLPECLTILLICGFMFHFCALYIDSRRSWIHLWVASLYLAYLALTKVFFGYVIVTVLMLSLGLLLRRRPPALLSGLLVFMFAMIWCVPYLWYTHSLTGRLFYWGTSGGMSLYWMSTPYPDELGSWFSVAEVEQKPELAPHREFFASLDGLSDVERDDAYKRQAINNITHHPGKYAENWAANVGRLLFSYPYSLTSSHLGTYFYMAPNMFVVVLFLVSVLPAVLRPTAIPFELWALLIFALTAFGGSTLLSAFDRQFRPLVPILCVWMAYVYLRVLQIDFRGRA
jgi:hypothetical protein